MPQYAVIGGHPPDNCPMTSKTAREQATKTYAQLPALLQKLNVKLVLDVHLDPGHRAFMLFEAPNAEAVRDLLLTAGFGDFLDLDFYLVSPISELLKKVQAFPTIWP